MLDSTICGGCGWQSEQTFTSLVKHLRGKEKAVTDYLSRPAAGPSDRLHRKERREAREADGLTPTHRNRTRGPWVVSRLVN
jgi:hypothetical protein